MGGCLRAQDSLWDGAHDARLAGDVVDEIPFCKVDRADWSVANDDLGGGVCPRPNPAAPYRAFFSSCHTGVQGRRDKVSRLARHAHSELLVGGPAQSFYGP